MSIRSEWKPRLMPRLILKKIEKECKRKRSLKTILPILATNLETKPNDFRKFSYSINGHRWEGYIYLKRNSLMGSLFTRFDNKFIIYRGYPRIKYSHDSQVMGKECVVENKIDGTNLGIWLLPNNQIMGKTRLVERWDNAGWRGRVWSKLFEKTGLVEPMKKLLKEDYQAFGELYGKENKGEFISYSIPIGFKVFDIVDRRTLGFVSFDEKIKLAQQFNLPTANLYWRGILTPKEVERIEFELSPFVKEDGMEGTVAKFYNTNDKDVYMAKLKCKEITEKAWSISSSHATIPRGLIGKAIQKAIENLNPSVRGTKKEFEDFVKQELLEEATEELVASSKDKIQRMIYDRLTPIQCKDEVFSYLDELMYKGIDIEHKGKIMSSLANRFIGFRPSILYRLYCAYLREKKNE